MEISLIGLITLIMTFGIFFIAVLAFILNIVDGKLDAKLDARFKSVKLEQKFLSDAIKLLSNDMNKIKAKLDLK